MHAQFYQIAGNFLFSVHRIFNEHQMSAKSINSFTLTMVILLYDRKLNFLL